MIEAFIVLLVGSVLIVILNKMPEKGVRPEKHKKALSNFFDTFQKSSGKPEADKVEEDNEDADEEQLDEPTSQDVLLAKADSLLKEDKLDEAEKMYFEVLKRDARNAQSYKGLGQICFKKKDYKDAHEIFDKLIKISPQDSSAYCNLGMCCFMQKNLKAALSNYEKALKIEKKPVYYKNLGITQYKLKNYNEASENLLKVVEKDDKDGESLDLLIGMIDKIDDKKKAEKIAQALLKVDPHNAVVKRQLSSLKKR